MPPEPKDVPALMRELVQWVNNSINDGDVPVPVVAALAHYQFATIPRTSMGMVVRPGC
jgi:Fic family protein